MGWIDRDSDSTSVHILQDGHKCGLVTDWCAFFELLELYLVYDSSGGIQSHANPNHVVQLDEYPANRLRQIDVSTSECYERRCESVGSEKLFRDESTVRRQSQAPAAAAFARRPCCIQRHGCSLRHRLPHLRRSLSRRAGMRAVNVGPNACMRQRLQPWLAQFAPMDFRSAQRHLANAAGTAQERRRRPAWAARFSCAPAGACELQ